MPADPSRNRPHVHDSPIRLKQFRHKLSQNLVPAGHLCRKVSQTYVLPRPDAIWETAAKSKVIEER